jgi:hypothetical protein
VELPECTEAKNRNLIINSSTMEVGCLMNWIFALAPLKVALPALFMVK